MLVEQEEPGDPESSVAGARGTRMTPHGQKCPRWHFSSAAASRSGSSAKELLTRAQGSFVAGIASFLTIPAAPL